MEDYDDLDSIRKRLMGIMQPLAPAPAVNVDF